MLVDEQQVSTVVLQCLFIFCLAWGLGSTMNAESRVGFDVFYRKMLLGENKHYPKPKLFKLQKNQIFPERYNIFEYVYEKKTGAWLTWGETVDKAQVIAPTAKVKHNIL